MLTTGKTARTWGRREEKKQKVVNSLLVLSFTGYGSGTVMSQVTVKTADIKQESNYYFDTSVATDVQIPPTDQIITKLLT